MVNKLDHEHECPFDIVLYDIIDTHLHVYHALYITPNMVTTFGLIFGIASAYNILLHNFGLAALFFAIAYYMDCVDGKLARKYSQFSVFGDYYDHFSDIFKMIVILYALYMTNPTRFIWTVPVFCLLVIGVLFFIGCQEKIYDDTSSSYQSIFKRMVPDSIDPRTCIQYAKHAGCGTSIFVVVLIIFWWRSAYRSK